MSSCSPISVVWVTITILNDSSRATLHEIFEPIINDIDRLVSEQISQARLKRVLERHPKGQEIKVNQNLRDIIAKTV
jgi:hypothetical protein